MNQIIIHVDMDAFYASVEMRDNPALRGKPLIIGSLPNERGVVATCSYEARKYGVHSAMNIKEAYRLCPNGVYMHPNFDKYRRVSDQLHDIWNTYATAAETVALDEAYLDVTEMARRLAGTPISPTSPVTAFPTSAGIPVTDGTAGAASAITTEDEQCDRVDEQDEESLVWSAACTIARTIKARTKAEVGLNCSIGVAYSKTAAKMASEEKKPDGYFEIPTPQDFVNLIIARDVQVLYTVGAKTAERLHQVGIHTVRDIQEHQHEVVKLLGKQGEWITQMAYGQDDRKVTAYRPEDAKSISRELTFQEDVDDFDFLKDVLLLLAISVERRAKAVDLYGEGVSLKLTFSNMKSISRSRLISSTRSATVIYSESVKLLTQVTDTHPVRLIGTGIYHLTGDYGRQVRIDDLMPDTASQQQQELDAALERLHHQYGLDFAGNLDKIFHGETLYRTVEYMRKHRRR